MILDDDEQAEVSRPTIPRRQQGGLMAVLGLLVPVVLGGVTVFGFYFLFLDDYLKKPRQPATEPASETSAKETPQRTISLEPRPGPTFAAPPPRAKPKSVSQRTNTPVKEPPVSMQDSQAEREAAAGNALRLAEKMFSSKPRAAPDWYWKVVNRYPGTKASLVAEDWLKKRAGGP